MGSTLEGLSAESMKPANRSEWQDAVWQIEAVGDNRERRLNALNLLIATYLHKRTALLLCTMCAINASMDVSPQIEHKVIERLLELLDMQNDDSVAIEREIVADGSVMFDATVSDVSHKFMLRYKSVGSLASVALAASQLRALSKRFSEDVVPVLAVPFMSESGREHCKEVGINWLDRSGNARIVAPGIYVFVEGHKNKFRRRGRPETPFGPSGSRIARWLLMYPGKPIRQRALASATGLNEGHVSRIVGRLIDLELVERGESGVQAGHPDRLLDVWNDEYRFDRHRIIEGHVSVVAGDGVVQQTMPVLEDIGENYAVTGLAAAWQLNRHAGYRLSTIYLEKEPSEELLRRIGFRREPRGANTWLVIPNDEGVFQGAADISGVRCVHPVQVYLDLKGHPERAPEAAAELRRNLFAVGPKA